jgi:tetratricopeptide (TPR) repeat protein
VFFERFREAAARLPAGLIRPVPPAAPEALARAAAALPGGLPDEYASFLRSFDGADLFHEAVVIAGVGPSAARALLALNADRETTRASDPPRELVFAEAQGGDRFVFDAGGRVLRLRAGSEERVLAGTSFTLWLDATVARERLLYGPDGEFAPDVFEEGGEEVLPRVALRQAERALRADPGSAEAEQERGVALRRLGRSAAALQAFAAAAALDPEDPWAWFDLGRTALEGTGDAARAAEAFRRAAGLERGPAAARLFVWAVRAAVAAGDQPAAAAARQAALALEPALAEGLARAAAAAAAEGDDDARAEAEALLAALAPEAPPRRRLPLFTGSPAESPVSERTARPPRPDRPRRPKPAGPRPAGVSRRGSRRTGR